MIPTRIHGIDIPVNLVIAVDVLTIHYDAEIWGPFDPNEFCPQRFSKEYKRHPASYFGFGIGPRNCVGIKFAYIEMKLVMAKILKSFEVISNTKTIDKLRFVEGTGVRTAKDDLIITLKKRN